MPQYPSMPSISSQFVPIQSDGRRRQKHQRHGNTSNDNFSDMEDSSSSHTMGHHNTTHNTQLKTQASHKNTRASQQSSIPLSTPQPGTSRQGDFLDQMRAQTRKHQESIKKHTPKTNKTHPSKTH